MAKPSKTGNPELTVDPMADEGIPLKRERRLQYD
jgi:hypothetical protein